jgi:hypothetical protein
MGKGKQKQKNPPVKPDKPFKLQVVGILMDASVTCTADAADESIEATISEIAGNLESHVDSSFSLGDNKITIDVESVRIFGQLQPSHFFSCS